jgi:hypothetical protein
MARSFRRKNNLRGQEEGFSSSLLSFSFLERGLYGPVSFLSKPRYNEEAMFVNSNSSYNLNKIFGYFNPIPCMKFESGLGPAMVYKFEPNISVKIYHKQKESHKYEVLLYKSKLPVDKGWIVPMMEIGDFIKDILNPIIKRLQDTSCESEYEDGFNT